MRNDTLWIHFTSACTCCLVIYIRYLNGSVQAELWQFVATNAQLHCKRHREHLSTVNFVTTQRHIKFYYSTRPSSGCGFIGWHHAVKSTLAIFKKRNGTHSLYSVVLSEKNKYTQKCGRCCFTNSFYFSFFFNSLLMVYTAAS